jgi:hypothetical protein
MIDITDPETRQRYLEIQQTKVKKQIIDNFTLLRAKIKAIKDKQYTGHYDTDEIKMDHGSFHPRGGEDK